jgi:hypothetical protein
LGTRIVCIECKKTFTNRQNARRHVRSIHSETGECFCSICNVSLTNIRTFNDHMRERHNVYKKRQIQYASVKHRLWSSELKIGNKMIKN